MRLNKIIVTGIAAAAVLAIAGCGSSSTGAASSAGETAPYAADSGDLLKYSGAYTEETGKGYSMLLTFTEEDSSVYVSVGHTDEDGTVYYDWEIYGEVSNNVITYSGASCLKETLDPESETGSSIEVVYNDGNGTIEITKDNKFIWKDEKVNDGEELVFAWDQSLNDKLKEKMQEQAQTGQN